MRPSHSAVSRRRRTSSRSTISAPKAATANSVMNTSSKAVRDDTKLTPSTIISTPAIVPMSVERLIRRTMRITSTARITPHTAPLNRQPSPV